MNTTYITLLSKKGMKELKKSIAQLEHRQKHMIAELRDLDKIDNHDQRLSRIEKLAQLETIEAELDDKRKIISSARLYPRKRDAFKVALGSVVDLIDASGRMVSYTVVDSIEANPSDGRISANSPLGQSLLGKTIKDTIEWSSHLRPMRMQLIAIK
jgi:transcription elongation factor GreA